MLFVSSVSFAETTKDSTTVDPGTIGNVERIIDKYSGKVYDLVKELALSLKVPVEKLLIIIAKQALVEAIVYLLVGLLAFFLIYKSYSKIKSITWDGGSPFIGDKQADAEMLFSVIFGFIGAIMFLVFICHLTTIVTGFVNPEFRIIEILSETLNGNNRNPQQ